MARAVRYHIGKDNKVSECRATQNRCPYQDFQTREGAETVLALQQERESTKERIRKMNEYFHNGATPRTRALIKLNRLQDDTHSFRAYAKSLDKDFINNGDDTKIQYTDFDMPKLSDAQKADLRARRTPYVDQDTGDLKSKWELTKHYTDGSKKADEKVTLDFEDDFNKNLSEAKKFITQYVRENKDESSDFVTEANNLYNDFRNLYTTVELESDNTIKVLNNPYLTGIGDFKNNSRNLVFANVEYQRSTLRPRIVERILKENPDYHSGVAPAIKLRIVDTDMNHGDAWWSATYNDGKWHVTLLDKGSNETRRVPITSPLQAKEVLYNFVKENMYKNDDNTANEKSDYLADFVLQMHTIKSENVKANNDANKPTLEAKQKHDFSKSNNLYGTDKQKGTLGKILKMFGQ